MALNQSGITIPLQVRGADQAEREYAKMSGGLKKIKAAQDEVARSAKQMQQAQRPPGGGGSAPGPASSRPPAALQWINYGGSAIGGAGGMVARGAGAAVRAGGGIAGGLAIGAGAAGLLLAGRAITGAISYFDSRMTAVVQHAGAIRAKIAEAGKSLGVAGVVAAGGQGLAVQRALAGGHSMEDIKNAQAFGISPDVLARVGTGGLATIRAGQRFGMSPDDMAGIMEKRGPGKGSDPFASAASIASELQNRSVGKEEIARARAGTAFGAEYDKIAQFQGGTANVGLDAILSGKASAAAGDDFEKASNPTLAALREDYKVNLEQLQVMHEIADKQGIAASFMQSLVGYFGGGEGSARERANAFAVDNGRALQRVSGAGN